jgi:hypothetical protein
MGSVGCFGQIENIKRQSLFYVFKTELEILNELTFRCIIPLIRCKP